MGYLQNLRLQTLFDPSFWNSSNGNNIGSSVSIPNTPSPFPTMDLSSPNPDSSPNPSINQPPVNPQQSEDDKINGWLKQMYNPEHNQQDRLNSLLNSYPNREAPEFQHHGVGGFLTKLAAIAGGMTGGPALYDDVMNSKFNDKLGDWKNQVGPIERAASLEKQSNSNERTMAMQTIADKLRNEAQVHKAQNDETNAKIRQQRADVYEYKAKNPGLKFNFSGPYVMVANPTTGQVTPFTDAEGNKIETGKMSDADKMALGEQNALERIDEKGNQDRKTGELKQEWNASNIISRGNQSRLTKETPSGNSSVNKPELPSQTRVREVNNASKLYNSRADLRPFIKINGNQIQVTPPSTGVFGGHKGPTSAQYKEINDAIYGSGVNTGPISSHENKSNPNPNPNPTKVNTNDLRTKATQILTTAKQPITEANIQAVIKKLGG